MKKIKTMDTGGRITVTHQSEERYPFSSQIVMGFGFKIVFLSMIFGLLPVTICGTRVKYFKCSISQILTLLYLVCFFVLSMIFIRLEFKPNLNAKDAASITNVVLVVASVITSFGGYIILLTRSYFVARKFPFVWDKLCKLVQISVIDVYGKKCHLFKEAGTFAKWSICEFIGILSTTLVGLYTIAEFSFYGFDAIFKHYHIQHIIPIGDGVTRSIYEGFQLFTFKAGYFVWKSCNSSHVLVSMLLCYVIMIITICLKSINQQIYELTEKVRNISVGSNTGAHVPRIKFKWTLCPNQSNSKNVTAGAKCYNDEDVVARLGEVGDTMLIIEDVMVTVGRLWGVSLIVETLVLIATGTTSIYNFLCVFQNGKELSELSIVLFAPSDLAKLFIAVSVHFYFLFKCCVMVDRMHSEARASLHLLKQASHSINLPRNIHRKIRELKHDMVSSTLALSASGYFQLNKYLLTSVMSQITTYVIVLLQFENSPLDSNNYNVTQTT